MLRNLRNFNLVLGNFNKQGECALGSSPTSGFFWTVWERRRSGFPVGGDVAVVISVLFRKSSHVTAPHS